MGRPQERNVRHGAGQYPGRAGRREQHGGGVRENVGSPVAAAGGRARGGADWRRRQARSTIRRHRDREKELRRVAPQRCRAAPAGGRQSRADQGAQAAGGDVERAASARGYT